MLPPGRQRQLGDQVARIHARPLDRSRPLWELHLIHGLEGGRLGLLIKVHHAVVDGVSGLELLGMLLDPTPDVREMDMSPAVAPRCVPGQLELLIRGVAAQSRQPARALRVVPNVLPNLDQMPMTRISPGRRFCRPPCVAPPRCSPAVTTRGAPSVSAHAPLECRSTAGFLRNGGLPSARYPSTR